MLDLFTGAFAVLAAPDGGSWAGAAGTAKASGSQPATRPPLERVAALAHVALSPPLGGDELAW